MNCYVRVHTYLRTVTIGVFYGTYNRCDLTLLAAVVY